MKLPVIVVNFKTYEKATGKMALELAKLHHRVSKATGVNLAIAPQTIDLRMIAEEVDIPVFAQHFHIAQQGSYTGHITPHSLKEAGVFGSILNHAEKKLPFGILKKLVDVAKEMGLFTIVCADSVIEGKAIAELGPDLIAVEPPELIGSNISVTSAKPELIIESVRTIGKGKVLVGAGIKTGDDVRASIEYGASGVLVASGITTANDPEKALYGLVEGVLKASDL
jgi:triosephosphate isomerase (TIM)